MAGQTQLSARLGSDNAIFKHDIPAKVKRSSFPYGRKRDFCIDPGMIVPIDLWETLPGDYFEVKLDYLLKSFPLKVPPFTTYKVRTHWYYCKKVDLWAGALTYMVKGRSHSISLSVPKIKIHSPSFTLSTAGSSFDYVHDMPMSLASFFGFAPGKICTAANVADSCKSMVWGVEDTDFSKVDGVNEFYGGVNALPFFMYQKLYRFAYLKPNLLQDNKVWFPDDMSDGWRINYSKSNLVTAFGADVSGDNAVFFTPQVDAHTGETVAGKDNPVPSVTDNAVNIAELRFAMFEDDRFTTALPWSTRGTPPKVDVGADVSFDVSGLTITVPDLAVSIADETLDLVVKQPVSSQTGILDAALPANSNELTDFQANGIYQSPTANRVSIKALFPQNNATVPGGIYNVSGTARGLATGLGFDINDLRAKIALTVWQERNATTQGYYNEMIYAHFNENPDSQDYEPRYLGGTSDIISFSEVIQHDNAENDTTPQGHSAGLGENRSSSHVFSYRCKDYGYIMGVMIIQPETVYNSKIEKLWLREIQEDEYFPEYQGLGLQEVLKGEIFPTGTSFDKDLFGYQERDTEYKTRDNQAIGFFALPHTVDRLMSAYSQCREFASQPSLSQQFVTMSPDNIRKDCLAVPSMPFFRCSLVTTIHAVRPLAYSTHPNTFGY